LVGPPICQQCSANGSARRARRQPFTRLGPEATREPGHLPPTPPSLS
jgi:hypothetical protein